MTRCRPLAQCAWRRWNASPQPRPKLARLTHDRPVCPNRAQARSPLSDVFRVVLSLKQLERIMVHAVRALASTLLNIPQRTLHFARRAFILHC